MQAMQVQPQRQKQQQLQEKTWERRQVQVQQRRQQWQQWQQRWQLWQLANDSFRVSVSRAIFRMLPEAPSLIGPGPRFSTRSRT